MMDETALMIKDYYWVVKPGIIYGNAVTVIGGFLLASRVLSQDASIAASGGDAYGAINVQTLILTLIGISLVIGSSCVFNNYIDRDIDAKMERTRERAFVQGRLSGQTMIIYAICLGLVGFAILLLYINLLTAAVAAVGFFDYVLLYSLWAKRSTVYSTLIGSIAGAVPPVVGYCAASNRFDAGAVILFAILVLWQMPHFYAIGIYRLNDYLSASIPIMPVEKGLYFTKVNMLFYILAFTIAAGMLAVFGFAGSTYFAVATLFGFTWLVLCIKGFWAADERRWARTMFFFSLATLMAIFIAMSVPLK